MKTPYRSFNRLVSLFKRVPGVGERGALRLVLNIAQMGPKNTRELASLILKVSDNLERCRLCNNMSFSDTCWICSDETRDRSIIMVVESVMDLLTLEEAGYRGLYHVVGGLVPSTKRIRDEEKAKSLKLLLSRLNGVKEVILGFPYTVRGEVLCRFFQEGLKDKVVLSRLARGIPSGAEVEFMDAATLNFSFKKRYRL